MPNFIKANNFPSVIFLIKKKKTLFFYWIIHKYIQHSPLYLDPDTPRRPYMK